MTSRHDDEQFPYWRRNLQVLPVSNLLSSLGFGIAWPFLPLMVRGLGVEDHLLATWIGNMALAFYIVSFLINPIWGGIAESLVLTAIPMFIFMGTMLERSGVASDLLHCLQVLLRRVPGGLALAVTIMGTVMAATTGIIGASVVMMSLLALPVMLARSYSAPLATGTIAASGTLGILMPLAIQSARKAARSPSLLLMPLSYASMLGGLITLVGLVVPIVAFQNVLARARESV